MPLAVVETNARGPTWPLPWGPFHILAHSPGHARRSYNISLCLNTDLELLNISQEPESFSSPLNMSLDSNMAVKE